MKKILGIVIVAALIVALIAGGSMLLSNERKILGSWEGEPMDILGIAELEAQTYTFNDDGTGKVSSLASIGSLSIGASDFTYFIEEDKITIDFDASILSIVDIEPITYTMLFEDDKLTLTSDGGEQLVLTKAE